MIIQRVLAAAVPLLVVLGHGGAATADEPWSALSVTPTTVQAGESVHMSGYCRVNGYPATPSLSYFWASKPDGAAPYGVTIDVLADGDGAFDISAPISIEAPSGAYGAVLGCALGDVAVTTPLVVNFAVEGGSDPVITTTTTPSTSTTVSSTLSVPTMGTVASPPAASPAPSAVARRGSVAFTG